MSEKMHVLRTVNGTFGVFATVAFEHDETGEVDLYPSVEYHEPGEVETWGAEYVTLYPEQLDALCKWWLTKTANVFALSEEEREAIEGACEYLEGRTVAMMPHTPKHYANTLRSLLTRGGATK